MHRIAIKSKSLLFVLFAVTTIVTANTAYSAPPSFHHPAIKTKYCEPYLWTPQTPSLDMIQSVGPFTILPNEDFSIREGGVYLNPTTRQVFYRGKKTALGPTDYIFFEALLLADGSAVDDHEFINEGLAAHEARANGRAEPKYDQFWVGANIKRVRTRLQEEFGEEFASRLITLRSRGYAWTSGAILNASESFPTDKVTYLYNQERVFVGREEVILTDRDMALLKAFFDSKTFHLSRESMMSLFERMGRDISDESYHRVAIARLNRGLRDMLGVQKNAITTERLSEVYVLDSKFFNLVKM